MPVQTRREFIRSMGSTVISTALLSAYPGIATDGRAGGAAKRPNIVMFLTDDQGYGDIGCHGNDLLKTPNIDGLARDGVEFTNFCVYPVCSPTRAGLMTGRYCYRTGVTDTYLGRSMMYPDEFTIAEALKGAGYRNGIFGKWHLGDNYPLRSIDQGFDESLICRGGGLAQPSGPPDNGYFDPILEHNGMPAKSKGYCTDIFTDAAITFIKEHRNKPFFTYLSYNAPHVPLEIDTRYVEAYRAASLDDNTARTYGMIANIDENVGRVLRTLHELGLEDNTIVIFFTDNGPQYPRYNSGFRDVKGSVYEGGIHVPFFMRWPARLEAGKRIDTMAAHIDLMPTLMDACSVTKPETPAFDGISLMPLLSGDAAGWPDRYLFFQWHRGDEPRLFENCAVRSQRYKLVNGKELYDLADDPGEHTDISDGHPVIVSRMRRAYEEWLKDVSSTRGYAPPRIALGTAHENPAILTRQDWRGPSADWSPTGLGYWEVDVARSAHYEITLRYDPLPVSCKVHFKLGNAAISCDVGTGSDACLLKSVALRSGPGRLEAWVDVDGRPVGMTYVDVRRP